MAEIQWIKLTTNMFDNRKIKYLRKLPNGDSIVLIWVMLLTMAGRCNAGGMIFLTEDIPYTPKMLADELDFEESTVTLALQALERLGMVSTTADGFLNLPGWEEHQNVAGMEKAREGKRIAQARWREKQKAFAVSTDGDVDSTVDSTVESTKNESNHAEREEDKEEEGDKEKKDILSVSLETDGAEKPKNPQKKSACTEVVAYLNQKAHTQYRTSTPKTQALIRAREAEGFTLADFKKVIDKKCAEWLGDTRMEQYLRPETLFGTKFEAYLNARISKPPAEASITHGDQSDLDDLF